MESGKKITAGLCIKPTERNRKNFTTAKLQKIILESKVLRENSLIWIFVVKYSINGIEKLARLEVNGKLSYRDALIQISEFLKNKANAEVNQLKLRSN